MEMEDDVESDLHALKKLYGLLQIKGNKKPPSQNLDEKARFVLKKLLDGATKQVIQSLPQEVIEEKPTKGVDAGDVIQQLQACMKRVDSVKKKASVATSHQTNIITDGNVETNGSTEAKATTSDHVSVAEAIRRYEARIKADQQEMIHRVDSMKGKRAEHHQLLLIHRVDSMKGKRAEHHQPSKMSQLEMKDESTQYSQRFEAQAKIVPSNTNKPVGFLSNDNELLSQKVRPLDSTPKPPASVAAMQTCKPTRQFDNLPRKCIDKKIGNTKKPDQIMSQPNKQVLPRQKDGRAVVSTIAQKRFELPSHPPSRVRERPLFSEELMASRNNTRNRSTVGETRPPRPVHVLNRSVRSNRPKARLVGSAPRNGLIELMNEPRPMVTNRRLSRTRENVILPTLLDQQLVVGPNRGTYGGGTHRNPGVLQSQSPCHQNHRNHARFDSESETESKSVTDSKSCSTSRSGSAPSESESYSTSGSSTQESCTGESELDPQPRRMMTHHRAGPTSRDTLRGHASLVVPSRQVGSSNGKEVGRLRRFKNKLGIIFHHYHHHQHHHHDEEEVGHPLDHDHHRSLWRYMGDMLHHSNSKNTAKRSAVRSAPRQQHQQGHLHKLVDGLLKHMRHSKKSKRSPADIRRLSKTGNCKRNAVVKKWHWWQKLYRRGSSNSVKPRVKVGFRTKRPMLSGP